MPPTIRIFFALELPEPVKAIVAKFLGELKRKAKSNGIRWTKPDNLHITLQFLPQIQPEHLSGMIRCVNAELAGFNARLSYQLGNIHLFPSPYRPRVIVLDVLPQESLAELAKHIGRGITAMQYDIDSRPFRAHITLGRIKHPDMNLHFLSSMKLPPIEDISVENVVLYQSEPQENGSCYTVLERIPLISSAAHAL